MKECDCDKKLPDIRMVKGNDLTVVALASVYDADSGAYIAFSLDACTGVMMRLVRSFNRIESKTISVDGDEVTATFAGSMLTTGTYGVEILFAKDGQDGRIFERDLFAIVADSGDASIGTAAGGGDGQGYNITVDIKSRTLRVGQVSGITDYNLLENRPAVNGHTLAGDQSAHDLGLATVEDTATKVDKIPGKGLSANDLTDERAGKVDILAKDGRANEFLNGAGTYSKPVRQGYGVSVADDNTVSVDPQVIARQSDVVNVADAIARVVAGAPEDLDTLKEIADYIASDKTGAAQMAAAISALKTLTAGHTKSIEDLGIAKQDALVSGTNIKTVNGVPVLGSGDIKTPVPTKVSELENDKGFLTEHQSLEAYYQKAAAQLDNRVVAEAIVSLAARLDALEGSRGLLGDATAGTLDVKELTKCRYPAVMRGHGVPAEANVPVNLPDGLPWDGVPTFVGQLYVNLDAASGGLYYAAGNEKVSDWKQA